MESTPDQAEDEYCSQEADRNMPCDDLSPDQERTADEERQRADFTDTSAAVAEEQIQGFLEAMNKLGYSRREIISLLEEKEEETNADLGM